MVKLIKGICGNTRNASKKDIAAFIVAGTVFTVKIGNKKIIIEIRTRASIKSSIFSMARSATEEANESIAEPTLPYNEVLAKRQSK